MVVQVVVHLERVPSEGVSWWAESPDLPGFSAAAPALVVLRALCVQTLHEMAEERPELLGAEIEWHLAATPSSSEGVAVSPDGEPHSQGAPDFERILEQVG